MYFLYVNNNLNIIISININILVNITININIIIVCIKINLISILIKILNLTGFHVFLYVLNSCLWIFLYFYIKKIKIYRSI